MTARKPPLPGKSLADFAAAVQLTQAKPRTATELSDLLGIHVHTALRYLNALAEEGLTHVTCRPGAGRERAYTWVPRE